MEGGGIQDSKFGASTCLDVYNASSFSPVFYIKKNCCLLKKSNINLKNGSILNYWMVIKVGFMFHIHFNSHSVRRPKKKCMASVQDKPHIEQNTSDGC